MKLHKIELVVVDFEGYGADDIIAGIKQSSDALIRCVSSKSVDVGGDYWSDDNIINSNTTKPSDVVAEFDRVYKLQSIE